MSSFLVVVHKSSALVDAAMVQAAIPALAVGVPGAATVSELHGGLAVEVRLGTGDSRIDDTRAERVGLTVVGQVRLDDRDALVPVLRDFDARISDQDSDIALFAAAWEHFGEHAPAHLIGDFAVAIWEHPSRRLHLARDRFGVRMLYYAETAHHVVVSNALNAVRAMPGVAGDVNREAIADFVAHGANRDPGATFYRDIRRVPPAHAVELLGRTGIRRYWSLEDYGSRPVRARSWPLHFRQALETSVRDRIRTSSVGVLMSGGIDSTSLAALAARHTLTPGHVRSVTVDLPTIAPSPDATRARFVAAQLGIGHEVIDGDGLGFQEGIAGRAAWQTPEPYDEHDLAVWRTLLAHCATHAPVLLYGEDPDSLFTPPSLRGLLRLQPPMQLGAAVLKYLLRWRRRPHLGIRGAHMSAGHPRAEAIARLTAPHWQPLLESLDPRVVGIPLDARLPFLDTRVIAVALNAPPIPWAQQKLLLREVMKGLLPDVVRLAPKAGLPMHTINRVAQWRGRGPVAFTPSDALREHVSEATLTAMTASRTAENAMLELRLRVLDRWLRKAQAVT